MHFLCSCERADNLWRKILFQPIISAENQRVSLQKSQRNIDSVAAPHRKEGEDHERIPASFCQRNNREELLREWDSERNLPLTPETVSYRSKKKVWWTCAHGHHWQAAVHTRTGSGTGCPYCSGRFPIPGENDLATKYPLLAQEWNTEKMVISPRATCSPAAIASFGGAAHMVTNGARRSNPA